jgi:hypothetical protein
MVLIPFKLGIKTQTIDFQGIINDRLIYSISPTLEFPSLE